MSNTRDYTAEIGEEIQTPTGTYRVRVEWDEDGWNPRDEDCAFGTMVCSHRTHNLPHEGDDRVDEAFERGGLRLAMRYLSVTQDAVVLPVYGYDHGQLRLQAGERTGSFNDRWDSGIAGVIYQQRGGEYAHLTDEQIVAALKAEVENYDTWANGEMTGYVVEKRCGECECWSTVDACWGYYSVEEAMEQGTATLETYHETTAYSLATCDHDET